jgi:HEAT repeat protein
MLYVVLVVIILVAALWWKRGNVRLSRNERLYLKRRGYEVDEPIDRARPVSKDSRLFGLIESLEDLSPYSRQRAAEELSKMCEAGERDRRMLSSLVFALDDSEPAVRTAVVNALGKLNDPAAIDHIKRRLAVEESIQVRAAAQRVLERLDVRG